MSGICRTLALAATCNRCRMCAPVPGEADGTHPKHSSAQNFWLTRMTKSQYRSMQGCIGLLLSLLVAGIAMGQAWLTVQNTSGTSTAIQTSPDFTEYHIANDGDCTADGLLCGDAGTIFYSRWAISVSSPGTYSGISAKVTRSWRCTLDIPQTKQQQYAMDRNQRIRSVQLGGVFNNGTFGPATKHSGVLAYRGNRVWLAWKGNLGDVNEFVSYYFNTTFFAPIEYNNVNSVQIECGSLDPSAAAIFLVIFIVFNGLTFLLLVFKLQLVVVVAGFLRGAGSKLSVLEHLALRIITLVFIDSMTTMSIPTSTHWPALSVLVLLQLTARWGAIFCILNADQISLPFELLDPLWLGTLAAPALMWCLGVWIWFTKAEAIYDDAFQFAHYGGTNFAALEVGGWVQVAQSGCVVAIAYAVIRNVNAANAEQTKEGQDYMFARDWLLARTFFWRLAGDFFMFGVVLALLQFFFYKNSEWFPFEYYISRDNLVLTAAQPIVMLVFAWVVVAASIPVIGNQLESMRSERKIASSLLKSVPYSSFSPYHTMRAVERTERRTAEPDNSEFQDKGYKERPLPEHVCPHGARRSTETCAMCKNGGRARFGGGDAALWELAFDPLLARSMARLSSEVYQNFLTDDDLNGQRVTTEQRLEWLTQNKLLPDMIDCRDSGSKTNRLAGISMVHFIQAMTDENGIELDGHLGVFENILWDEVPRNCPGDVEAVKAKARKKVEAAHRKVKESAATIARCETEEARTQNRDRLRAHMQEQELAEKDYDEAHLLQVKRRRIIFAFRGTASTTNAKTDLDSSQVEFHPGWMDEEEIRGHLGDVINEADLPYVHRGFAKLAAALRELICETFRKMLSRWHLEDQEMLEKTGVASKTELVITGHSLGGALACITAMHYAGGLMKVRGVAPDGSPIPHLKPSDIKLITFGQPRVGNVAFAKLLTHLVPDYWRLYNEGDPVTTIPKHVAYDLDSHRPHCYYGKRRYKHAGHPVLIKSGGNLVFIPGILDDTLSPKPSLHSILLYEDNLEIYLKRRRRWLWRKAMFTVRLLVKWRFSCTSCPLTPPRRSTHSLKVLVPPNEDEAPPSMGNFDGKTIYTLPL